MLKTIWKLIRTAVIVIGVLLTFFAVLEILQAYQILRDMHPIAGFVFLAIIAGLLGWLIVYVWGNLAVFPKALKPPKIDNVQTATDRQLKKYIQYLKRFLQRLITNPNLSDDDRSQISTVLSQLESQFPSGRTETLNLITSIEDNHIKPVLKTLDAAASKQVRDSMRDIMVGVTLSPYKSADLLIVLYRNLVMVVRIVKVYRVRPALSEQLRIFSDIINVIATVNYINMGKNLIEGLGSRVPGIGRFVDDIAQGIGAGFMTTITGHAAMQRCRAFRGWNEVEAKKHLLSHVGDFYNDVKDIFFKDVWSGIRSRAGSAAAEATDKVADAIDETGSVVDTFIRTPVKAAGAAGQAVVDTTAKSVSVIGNILTKPFKKPKSNSK
ncbi:MAG: YcjF family protein [Planctomycetota bacterium]